MRIAVPVTHAGQIREALAQAGAGVQGNYDHCSGSWRGIGRFRPLSGARPAIGREGQIEEVEEELIETLCHEDLLEKVIAEVKKVHPYEEPAIDIIPRLEIADMRQQ
ncbi:MAG: hypothetical protein HY397_01175 [Candidatus Doudnabacteria bacterium]|nr:hypothetical protein [Candidatus Doudnabacteria bacterium]